MHLFSLFLRILFFTSQTDSKDALQKNGLQQGKYFLQFEFQFPYIKISLQNDPLLVESLCPESNIVHHFQKKQKNEV